jgi:hypothetical protein
MKNKNITLSEYFQILIKKNHRNRGRAIRYTYHACTSQLIFMACNMHFNKMWVEGISLFFIVHSSHLSESMRPFNHLMSLPSNILQKLQSHFPIHKNPSFFVMVFNATFNTISVIAWLSALLLEKTVIPGENQRPGASYWQALQKVFLFHVMLIYSW